jgi:hypothetical protein
LWWGEHGLLVAVGLLRVRSFQSGAFIELSRMYLVQLLMGDEPKLKLRK